jgi:hypothetical protein
MNKKELKILENLDKLVRQESASEKIDSIVLRVEQKLIQDPAALLAGEPVPLAVYGQGLPNMIRSSWVFAVRTQATTGAERHPNSHQRMLSYRGSGDIQIWNGKRWSSNPLVSDSNASLESRWMSIPTNVWHQAVVPKENWVVVSFHTVPEDELIEERPDVTDTELIHQRRYMEEIK